MAIAQLVQLINDPAVASAVTQLIEKLLADVEHQARSEAERQSCEIERQATELHAAKTKIDAASAKRIAPTLTDCRCGSVGRLR